MTDRVEEAKAEARASRSRLIATLGEVQSRLSPRTMVNEAVSALKDNGANLIKGGVAAIKKRPVEAAASLLSFAGPAIKWLNGKGRQRHYVGDSIMSSTVEDNSLNRNRKAGTDLQRETAASRASGKLSNVAGTAAAKAREARGYAQEKLADAREAASSTYSNAVEKGGELAHTARAKAGQVAHQVEEQVQTTPLSVVIGGIALGTILGLVLPKTRREAELLGDAGRRVTKAARSAVQSAKDAGQERLDQLGATGEAALKVAKLVGEKSGLTAAVSGKAATTRRPTPARASSTAAEEKAGRKTSARKPKA